jgi:hypothetical protein
VRCPSRRNFLSGTAALAATAALAPLRSARAQGASKKTRLVLLGTGGGPRVIPNGRAKSAPDDNSITDEMWAEGVRKHYGGQIIVGRDLLEI